mgnify:CR=1 FL=1
MGISCCMLLKQNSNINVVEMYDILQKICVNFDLYIEKIYIEVNEKKKIKSIRTNVSDRPFDEKILSRQLCVDIFDEPYNLKNNIFEWFDKSKIFFEAIVVDYFDGNEDLLFKIMFAIVLKYPEAKLWIEEDWFYTLEDLKKIEKNKPFDMDWCYKNPKDFL